MGLENFVRDCIATHRSVGLFSDDFFLSDDVVFKKLDQEIGFFENYELLSNHLHTVYSALLALDENQVANINIVDAAKEQGQGYYQQTIQQLVSCFSKNVEVTEEYSPNIVTVTVSAELITPWNSVNGASAKKTIRQSFAPERASHDYLFYESLLKQLLGQQLSRVRLRPGAFEEYVIFIFAPEDFDRLIIDFENKYFDQDCQFSEPLVPDAVIVLPELNNKNIDEVFERLAYGDLSEREVAPIWFRWIPNSAKVMLFRIGDKLFDIIKASQTSSRPIRWSMKLFYIALIDGSLMHPDARWFLVKMSLIGAIITTVFGINAIYEDDSTSTIVLVVFFVFISVINTVKLIGNRYHYKFNSADFDNMPEHGKTMSIFAWTIVVGAVLFILNEHEFFKFFHT